MSKKVKAIENALKEIEPKLAPVYTKHGEKAIMVIHEAELLTLAMKKAGVSENAIRSTLDIMVGLGILKRYADKNGAVYIDAGIGEQG